MRRIEKPDNKTRIVMVRLRSNQDFLDWFDAVIRKGLIRMRDQNDTEPDELAFRQRQGAIQAFKNITEDFNKAPDDLKRGERNQAKSEA